MIRYKKMELVESKRRKKTRLKQNKEEKLDELVDGDGSPIEGDRNPLSDTEIETAPQQTTDDFAQSGIQPNNYYGYGFGGSPYSSGSGSRLATESKRFEEIIKRILREGK